MPETIAIIYFCIIAVLFLTLILFIVGAIVYNFK